MGSEDGAELSAQTADKNYVRFLNSSWRWVSEVADCSLTRTLQEEFFGEGELQVRVEEVAGSGEFCFEDIAA